MSMASAFRRALAVVVAVALAAPAIAGVADPPRYRAYYDVFDRGPANVPGFETSLVPQGLTYWAARDALIISYYDTAGGPSRIAVVDRNSGRYIKTLLLRTTGHVGGLGMTESGHLWVATNNKLFRYPASTLDRSAEAQTVDSDRTYQVPASSFVGVRGNGLWVGQFKRSGTPFAYPYRVDAFGGLQRAGLAFPVPTPHPGHRRHGPALHLQPVVRGQQRQPDHVGRPGVGRRRAQPDRPQHGRGDGLRRRGDPRALRERRQALCGRRLPGADHPPRAGRRRGRLRGRAAGGRRASVSPGGCAQSHHQLTACGDHPVRVPENDWREDPNGAVRVTQRDPTQG
jgi:hypothetical protein